MGNKDAELKLLVIFGAVFIAFILFRTRLHEKKRPILLLILYMIYVLFQCFNLIEFYPLTGFQMYSFPEERAVNYTKLIAVRDDGSQVDLPPHKVLPALADGRTRRYARQSMENQTVADQFAEAYAKGYDKRIRQPGAPGIREIIFEKWKWDFIQEPDDPQHGFVTKRVSAKPKPESAHA